MIPRKQIGFNQEENLLWEISKQLDKTISTLRTTGVVTTLVPTTTTTTTPDPCPNCIQDTVDINGQIWDTCNLNVETYRDGSIIPQVQDTAAWAALTTGAWCYYDNDPLTEATYGKLYNWYAVTDPRGLTPLNKSIPTDAEWTALVNFLGGNFIAGGPMKQTGLCFWVEPNESATNTSGFTGLPGGLRNASGSFSSIYEGAWWWSSTASNALNSWTRSLDAYSPIVIRFAYGKNTGMSVRCLNV